MTKEQEVSVNELRELARATQSYILQDSKSERRRKAMLAGCQQALEVAQEAFGDEE